ncbi:MAG: phosphotransferase [Planctomycetota bacterium]
MPIVRAADLVLGDEELDRIAGLFGLRKIEPIGGFENLLFRSTDPPGVVVRVTHAGRRSVDQIRGEFEFVEHLARRGAPVVRPVHTKDGHLCVERLTEAGAPVLIVAMSAAPGAHKSPELWTSQDCETYGRTLGRLHVAANDFVPSKPSHRRPPWFGSQLDPGFGDDPLRSRFETIVDRARAVPAGGTELLIHQDAHHGNLHVAEDGTMTLFDFDDCAYGSATHDLAICLFYRFFGEENLDHEAIASFTGPFLRGYTSVHKLPETWPHGVDDFLSLREVTVLFLTKTMPKKRPIHERFLERAARNVREDAPYLDLPASEWANPSI